MLLFGQVLLTPVVVPLQNRKSTVLPQGAYVTAFWGILHIGTVKIGQGTPFPHSFKVPLKNLKILSIFLFLKRNKLTFFTIVDILNQNIHIRRSIMLLFKESLSTLMNNCKWIWWKGNVWLGSTFSIPYFNIY